VLRSRQGSNAKERICRPRGWNGRPSTGKRSIAERFSTTRLRFPHRTRLARDQECDKRAHRHELPNRRHSLIRLGTDCPSSGYYFNSAGQFNLLLEFFLLRLDDTCCAWSSLSPPQRHGAPFLRSGVFFARRIGSRGKTSEDNKLARWAVKL
jgi:hypothetical protein